MDSPPEPEYICERCLTGHLRPRRVTLAEWAGGEFVTVPDFPAWVCDLCGAREYDDEALEHLQAVLGPERALRRSRAARRAGRGRPRPGPRPAGPHSV